MYSQCIISFAISSRTLSLTSSHITKGEKRISEEAHRYRVCSVFWMPVTNITFYKPFIYRYEKQLLSLFIWMHTDSMESLKHFCQLTTSTKWKHCPNAITVWQNCRKTSHLKLEERCLCHQNQSNPSFPCMPILLGATAICQHCSMSPSNPVTNRM